MKTITTLLLIATITLSTVSMTQAGNVDTEKQLTAKIQKFYQNYSKGNFAANAFSNA